MKISNIKNPYISNIYNSKNQAKQLEALKEIEQNLKDKKLRENLIKIMDEIIEDRKDPQHLIDLLA